MLWHDCSQLARYWEDVFVLEQGSDPSCTLIVRPEGSHTYNTYNLPGQLYCKPAFIYVYGSGKRFPRPMWERHNMGVTYLFINRAVWTVWMCVFLWMSDTPTFHVGGLSRTSFSSLLSQIGPVCVLNFRWITHSQRWLASVTIHFTFHVIDIVSHRLPRRRRSMST